MTSQQRVRDFLRAYHRDNEITTIDHGKVFFDGPLSKVIARFAGGLLRESAVWVAHTREVIVALNHVLSLMKNAEAGQRGFLITGDEKYLERYHVAIAGRVRGFAIADGPPLPCRSACSAT